jgi:hypothetical protein
MSSESVCQVTQSCMDVGSFHTRLVVNFMIFTVSVRNVLDTPSHTSHSCEYVPKISLGVGIGDSNSSNYSHWPHNDLLANDVPHIRWQYDYL